MHSRKRSRKQSAPVITYSSHPQHPVPEVSNVNVNEINTTKSPSLKDLQNYYSSEFCSIANLAKQAIPLEHQKAQAWRNEICLYFTELGYDVEDSSGLIRIKILKNVVDNQSIFEYVKPPKIWTDYMKQNVASNKVTLRPGIWHALVTEVRLDYDLYLQDLSSKANIALLEKYYSTEFG